MRSARVRQGAWAFSVADMNTPPYLFSNIYSTIIAQSQVQLDTHFSGIVASGWTIAGNCNNWPVMGESEKNGSSRARRTAEAVRLPPAEHPPTIKPCLGDAWRESQLETACTMISPTTKMPEAESYPFQALVSVIDRGWERMFRC